MHWADDLIYLGWRLSLSSGFWSAPPRQKQDKVLREFAWHRLHPRRVSRRALAQLLGFLLWLTQVRIALRAFLAPLFTKLNKPGMHLPCLGLNQLDKVPLGTRARGSVCRVKTRSDVQKRWRICEIGGQPVRFVCAGGVVLENGAADAWVGAALAGLGGWLCSSRTEQLWWFHLKIRSGHLPASWSCPTRLREAICALEVLAPAKVDRAAGGAFVNLCASAAIGFLQQAVVYR